MSDDLPFRCAKCGAFVKSQRLHEADDYGPMPCQRCRNKKREHLDQEKETNE